MYFTIRQKISMFKKVQKFKSEETQTEVSVKRFGFIFELKLFNTHTHTHITCSGVLINKNLRLHLTKLYLTHSFRCKSNSTIYLILKSSIYLTVRLGSHIVTLLYYLQKMW